MSKTLKEEIEKLMALARDSAANQFEGEAARCASRVPHEKAQHRKSETRRSQRQVGLQLVAGVRAAGTAW